MRSRVCTNFRMKIQCIREIRNDKKAQYYDRIKQEMQQEIGEQILNQLATKVREEHQEEMQEQLYRYVYGKQQTHTFGVERLQNNAKSSRFSIVYV